jgi:hypothetical protein
MIREGDRNLLVTAKSQIADLRTDVARQQQHCCTRGTRASAQVIREFGSRLLAASASADRGDAQRGFAKGLT